MPVEDPNTGEVHGVTVCDDHQPADHSHDPQDYIDQSCRFEFVTNPDTGREEMIAICDNSPDHDHEEEGFCEFVDVLDSQGNVVGMDAVCTPDHTHDHVDHDHDHLSDHEGDDVCELVDVVDNYTGNVVDTI